MRRVVEFLDRLFAVLGALLFSQFPTFIQQYKQQLAGHVAELQFQVDLINQIAMQSGKTITEFIEKFRINGDADFARQGDLMNTMVQRWKDLSDAYLALSNASLFTKPFVFFANFYTQIFKSTYQTFSPGFAFTLEGVIYALVGIAVGYGSFQLLKLICIKIGALFNRPAEGKDT